MTTPDRAAVVRPDVAGTHEKALADDGAHSSRRLPEFFLVGHLKCGTTALYRMLRQHPELYMPGKEPKYFSPELRSRFHKFGPRKLPGTLEGYLSLFDAAQPGQRVGEATPHYLMSAGAAERIAELQPAAQIVATFREPVSFLRSFHLQAVHNHVESQKDFASALKLEDARRRGKRIPPFSQSPPMLFYSEHVRYTEQLRRYREHFAPEQIKVLIYDDFRADNRASAREVLRFLEVDDSVELDPVETRRLNDVRSMSLHQLNGAVSVARRGLGRVVPALAYKRKNSRSQNLRRRLVYTTATPPDPVFVEQLRRLYKPEVEALSEYLGRDLVSLWGYGDID